MLKIVVDTNTLISSFFWEGNEAELFRKIEQKKVTLFISQEILIGAVKYRYKNLSFFDCVGYIFSIKNKFKFVTGDREFENLPRVEFVK